MCSSDPAAASLPLSTPALRAQNRPDKLVYIGENQGGWKKVLMEEVAPAFEKETGIKVRYDNFDNNEIVHAKLVAGKTGYDIVVPSSYWAKLQADGGLLRKIDKSQIPNYKNLDPEILQILQGFDPGNEYGVPYTWGTVGFTYNMDLVKKVLPDAQFDDLATIFDPANAEKLASCGI